MEVYEVLKIEREIEASNELNNAFCLPEYLEVKVLVFECVVQQYR
jgi:hypothetical protein